MATLLLALSHHCRRSINYQKNIQNIQDFGSQSGGLRDYLEIVGSSDRGSLIQIKESRDGSNPQPSSQPVCVSFVSFSGCLRIENDEARRKRPVDGSTPPPPPPPALPPSLNQWVDFTWVSDKYPEICGRVTDTPLIRDIKDRPAPIRCVG